MEIPVITLPDAVGACAAERILIKLGIEGMEVEALSTFIPSERRAVHVVGELHDVSRNAPLMKELFSMYGWTLKLGESPHDTCNFRDVLPRLCRCYHQSTASSKQRSRH